jgi:hypothetical protein
MTKAYRLAALFTMDHHDRGCGVTDKVLRRGKHTVIVEMDGEGYSDMLTDADYYWDMRDEMDGLEGIVRSAKRVLDVLLREGPPPGYTVTRHRHSYRVVPIDQKETA